MHFACRLTVQLASLVRLQLSSGLFGLVNALTQRETMQRCFACSLSVQTDCSKKKKICLSLREASRAPMSVRANFLVLRGKVESIQVFGLEAFPQGVVQNVWHQLTHSYCTTTGKSSGGGNVMAVFMLLRVEVHVAETQLMELLFQIFPVFWGSANQKKFSVLAFEHKTITFCIATTILCKTDYGSNDYYVNLMETGLNPRESWHKLCLHYRVAQNLSNMFKMSMKHSCEMVGFGWCYATNKHKIPRSSAVG